MTVPVHHNYIADGIVHHNTIGGGAEWAIHLTGRYPDWWEGATFEKPPILWAGSVTGESTRDNPQRILVGAPAKEEEWGTGLIPKDAIVDWDRALGVPNLLDNIVVRWGGGGDIQQQHSQLAFKAYEKGREKWQGPTVDGVWFDEEPPLDIYSEGLTRTNRGQRGQFAQQTFTPLQGMSEVVMRFLRPDENDPGAKSRTVVSMTIDDVEHYTDAEKAKIVASYAPHERDARSRGVPSLGSGAIYPVPWSEVTVAPFRIPDYWPRAYALDVGWNRTAALWGAKDRETGVLYIYAEHYRGQAEPSIHAEAIKARGQWIKGAIDPASRGGSQKDGEQLMAVYRGLGLDLTPAINAVEAGLYEVWQALSTGRIKFFSTLQNTEHEYRIYHRDEKGRVVKENDHLMDDLRYLWMTWDRVASVKPVERTSVPSIFASDTKAGY